MEGGGAWGDAKSKISIECALPTHHSHFSLRILTHFIAQSTLKDDQKLHPSPFRLLGYPRNVQLARFGRCVDPCAPTSGYLLVVLAGTHHRFTLGEGDLCCFSRYVACLLQHMDMSDQAPLTFFVPSTNRSFDSWTVRLSRSVLAHWSYTLTMLTLMMAFM